MFITNGSTPITGGATVLARTPDRRGDSYTCFLVDAGTPGFTAETMRGKMMWRASNTAYLRFRRCQVLDAQVLGQIGEGHRHMLQALDAGRLGIAALGLGMAQGAFELALDYAQTRRQFGRRLADFEGIGFKLADMAVAIEHARAYLYQTCRRADAGKAFGRQAAIAKLFCSERANQVVDAAVQIFGGRGLIKDCPLERFYRDQRGLQIGEGTSEILRLIILKHIDGKKDQKGSRRS